MRREQGVDLLGAMQRNAMASIRELEFEGEEPASATVIPAPVRKLQSLP